MTKATLSLQNRASFFGGAKVQIKTNMSMSDLVKIP